MKASRIETVEIRNKLFRVRHWGSEEAPPVFMLHGWMDSSASFQFVVDALQRPWHVIAPDWRGHGGSHRTGESYPFLQLVADLDALLEHYSPGEPVRLVGHSLGANASCAYAGARPERVQRLVNLEGLAPVPGIAKGTPAEQVSQWLAALRKGVRNRPYRSHEELSKRLRQADPHLTSSRADFLAREFSREGAEGSFEFDVDPFQHANVPMLGHELLVESAWPRITAPVLLITSAESHIFNAFARVPRLFDRRVALLRQVEHVHLEAAAHNLHLHQPEQVAALIERFLS